MATVAELQIHWGRKLRKLRRDRELTVTEVAEKAGISRNSLHRIESGEHGARDEVRLALAAALGVPVADIFDYDDALESA